MPTTEYTIEHGPLNLDFLVLYTADAIGRRKDVELPRLQRLTVTLGDKWFAWPWPFERTMESKAEDLALANMDEICKQIDDEIDAAREADRERRADLARE